MNAGWVAKVSRRPVSAEPRGAGSAPVQARPVSIHAATMRRVVVVARVVVVGSIPCRPLPLAYSSPRTAITTDTILAAGGVLCEVLVDGTRNKPQQGGAVGQGRDFSHHLATHAQNPHLQSQTVV